MASAGEVTSAAEAAGWAKHVLYYTSPVDGAELPYHVTAPASLGTEPLPVVFLLHDTLAPATAAEFVEAAFRNAASWTPVMDPARPAILVQPFGRGNAAWIGPAGRDFFDVWEHLRPRFLLDENAASLLGFGSGATGALQLATWFPGRFAAVAAIGAWTDDRLDLPIGLQDWFPWERTQRKALAPRTLAANLRNVPVFLDHPASLSGVGGTAGPAHLLSMLEALSGAGVSVAHHESGADRRAEVWNWLLSQRRIQTPNEVAFTAFSARSESAGGVRIEEWEQPGLPASVVVRTDPDALRVKTRGVRSLAVQSRDRSLIRIDESEVSVEQGFEAVLLSRWDNRWQVDPSIGDSMYCRKSPELPGPVCDLHWNGATIVYGTLGEEHETAALEAFARGLQSRLRSGFDSANPHPGDRSISLEYPIVRDAEAVENPEATGNVIVVGSPRSNLLLARWRMRLPIYWLDQKEVDAFVVREKEYMDPLDAAFVLGPHPETDDAYAYVVAPASVAALSAAERVRTAHLPDYFVHRRERVLIWGYFDSQWR